MNGFMSCLIILFATPFPEIQNQKPDDRQSKNLKGDDEGIPAESLRDEMNKKGWKKKPQKIKYQLGLCQKMTKV